ncbi:DUF3891 family protein [Virgibacillus flavescens]|uniref:DUF3891 family protein n=1 Tax=Virgibacillus flavescens TaxID=1611422 RepID=UPI003D340FEA
MIVRERKNDIVMISQDDHARISGKLAKYWNASIFKGQSNREAVELAINEHDRAWISVDSKPFWNDKSKLPYSFTDLPNEPKLVFYKNGIDEVEEMNAYAGLLCSQHYMHFTMDDASEASQRFVVTEQLRQKRIRQLKNVDEASFQFHFDLLKFCDNLSLYVCLNEPGSLKEKEHYFFKNGLPVPSTFSFFSEDKLDVRFRDSQTITLSEFPFEEAVVIHLPQKVVDKDKINKNGIIAAYEQTPVETVEIIIKAVV